MSPDDAAAVPADLGPDYDGDNIPELMADVNARGWVALLNSETDLR
jgi:hypothetical protein